MGRPFDLFICLLLGARLINLPESSRLSLEIGAAQRRLGGHWYYLAGQFAVYRTPFAQTQNDWHEVLRTDCVARKHSWPLERFQCIGIPTQVLPNLENRHFWTRKTGFWQLCKPGFTGLNFGPKLINYSLKINIKTCHFKTLCEGDKSNTTYSTNHVCADTTQNALSALINLSHVTPF